MISKISKYLLPFFFAITLLGCANSNKAREASAPSITAISSSAPSQTPTPTQNARANYELSMVPPDGKGCIPPIALWTYRPLLPPTPSEPENPIPPSIGWELAANLPVAGEKIEVVLARTNEVWVLFARRGGLWRYEIDTGHWKEYTQIGETEGLIPKIQFISSTEQGNQLWALGYKTKTDSDETTISDTQFFSRYNDATDRFEFVESDESLLATYWVGYGVRQDQAGIIWTTAQKRNASGFLISGAPFTLISFDPSTGNYQTHGDIPWPGNFELDEKGNLWMLVGTESPYLAEYIPETKETIAYPGIPPAISGINVITDLGLMYFDRAGNLWLDDRGYLEFSDSSQPVWYQLITPSIFLTDQAGGENRGIVYAKYNGVFQSRDRMYWFTSTHFGMANLNPDTGEWCKFTNGSSPIGEDNQGNLWIALFGKLYKHDLQQK